MASFEPVVLLFGSNRSIAAARLRLPVPLHFAFDVDSLEELVNASAQLTDISLPRYFVVLLDAVEEEVLMRLRANHRVIAVYTPERMSPKDQEEINRLTHSVRQLTLDLTNDIVQFLQVEGQKQLNLERTALVKIYYHQARALKEWVMSSVKAEPCHILLISLNSSEATLNQTQQRLQDICAQIGYPSTIIRQLQNYLPKSDQYSSLLPYARLMFENEKPRFMCQLIGKLSPIRLYIYGNLLSDVNVWSELMIKAETQVMDDEDNWCAFLEGESIADAVKWNFAFLLGKEWKVPRVTPMDWNQLNDHPQFYSALRRAHQTFAERQIEVTAEVFDWYSECCEQGFLHAEPKLSSEQSTVKHRERMEMQDKWLNNCRFRYLRSFDYSRLTHFKANSVAFIWLDQILRDADEQFRRLIEPFHWHFFDRIPSCVSFIESQLREQRYVFLVASGTLGEELFLAPLSMIQQIFAAYIFCAHLTPHQTWSQDYTQIRGVYNDLTLLANQIGEDYRPLQISLDIDRPESRTTTITTENNPWTVEMEVPWSLPMIVLNGEEAPAFIAHQRTIDNLLCLPRNDQSKDEMFEEFRRLFDGNELGLAEVENFSTTYHSHAALRWYTRDSFVWRTINQVLRASDVEAMFKLRYILTDLYTHLSQTYKQRCGQLSYQVWETYYRGQLMFRKDFEHFNELQGNVIAIKTFLSGTTSMQIALMFAGKYLENTDLVSVVFSIETEMDQVIRPYANISVHSMFPDEDEVLFAMGSVFRVGNIRLLPDEENIWTIQLRTVNQNSAEFNQLPSLNITST